jgi:hypothetical protein
MNLWFHCLACSCSAEQLMAFSLSRSKRGKPIPVFPHYFGAAA